MSTPPESAPLFAGIPAAHTEWALQFFRVADVDYGQRLIEEGDVDETMVCVLDGELEVRTGDVVLSTVRPGEVVGEIALFNDTPRTASVETNTRSRLLLLPREGYIRLRNAGSPVAHAIEEIALALLVKRLRSVSKRISELAEGTPYAPSRPAAGFFARVAALFGHGHPGPSSATFDAVPLLKSTSMFRDAPAQALEELAGRLEAVALPAGYFVCTEGEVGREMYFVAGGEIEVLVGTDEDRVESLATLAAGDAFGMCSLVEDLPRMASCVARDDATVLVLDGRVWDHLILSGGVVGSVLRTAVIRCLSEQLAYANAQLAQLDMTRMRKARTGEFDPLLRASAGVEAYGSHVRE